MNLLLLTDDATARELSGYVRLALVLLEREYQRQGRGDEIPPSFAELQVVAVPPALTIDQAARHAGVTVRTIARWRGDGLRSTGDGRRVLIGRDDLDRWVGHCRTSP